jgi:hypothetical protein
VKTDFDPMTERFVGGHEGVQGKVQHTTPCGDCPWRRNALSGWLGALAPDEWVRVAHSDCHVDCHSITNMQCAGIAIYRRNVVKRCDPPNMTLPADREKVFATPAEFLQYHQRMQGVRAMPVPIVPTGPTKGQERSRKQGGGYGNPPSWREKRSDAGQPRKPK